jgi:aminoacylase
MTSKEKKNGSAALLLSALSRDEEVAAIDRFCQLITFPTVSSLAVASGAYHECATWLLDECRDILDDDNAFWLPEAPDSSPVVVAVWKGRDASLPILLLNSHYDVVPADVKDWSVPPFDGLRKNGRIYGRGTQDMKCVCTQYLEAIRQIKKTCPDFIPARTIYLTFVPDEEVGGGGMAAFLSSDLYQSLPGIALALDEGLASTDDTFSVFYGERLPCTSSYVLLPVVALCCCGWLLVVSAVFHAVPGTTFILTHHFSLHAGYCYC